MAHVRSVHISPEHGFSKTTVITITLLVGKGVEGDAHCGETVKHRSRVAANPNQPNLRQVHFMMGETIDAAQVPDGDMGENITTAGIDLHALPVNTELHIGKAVLLLTGLRNPCAQINEYRDGLLPHFREVKDNGEVIRRAGVMAIVVRGGDISTNDLINVVKPTEPHEPLKPV
jgi:MOSC domain-containing protein YiiM